ncbi:MAG: hypothetical protein K1X89_07815 [Myxococcaceae bacterium]|nr:hypothetical protein [Myxococcaceae bacterium]
MLALLLALSLAQPPNARVRYERQCLYCHSAQVAEAPYLTVSQWERVIARERLRAPVLIAKSDVPWLARFLVGTLRRGPSTTSRVDRTRPEPAGEPDAGVSMPVIPAVLAEAVDAGVVDPKEVAAGAELESAVDEGVQTLIRARCSKCHTLGRVYRKLDSLEIALTTVQRMRLKTGSGISAHELELIERYLKSQF